MHRRLALKNEEKENNELEFSVIALHDYVKVSVALEILYVSKGKSIFPRTTFGSDYPIVVLEALEIYMERPSADDKVTFLNKRMKIGT